MKSIIKLASVIIVLMTSFSIKAQCSVYAGQDITICCPGGTDTLRAIANMTNCSCTNYSYSWTPTTGLSNPTSSATAVSPTVSTVYQVCVTAYKNKGCFTYCCTACDSVTVTVNNACCRLGKFNNESDVANKNYDKSSINVFPNPASSEITIETTAIEENSELRFYDSYGKLIWKRSNINGNNKFKIDVSQLPKGIYLAEIYAGNKETLSKKIIIE